MKQVPLLFAFMTRRRTADYVAIFEQIKKMLYAPQVSYFVSDFEMAVWKAVERCFPGKPHRGCAFHWAQAVMKRIKDHYSLFPHYINNSTVRNIIEELMCLCYLKHTEIGGVFRQLHAALRNTQSLSGTVMENLEKLFKYIDRNWVSRGYWHPSKWSVYYKHFRYESNNIYFGFLDSYTHDFFQLINSTNNDCEGEHFRWNMRSGGYKKSCYPLAIFLHKEATMVETNARLVAHNKLNREHSKAFLEKEKKMFEEWESYRADKKAGLNPLPYDLLKRMQKIVKFPTTARDSIIDPDISTEEELSEGE